VNPTGGRWDQLTPMAQNYVKEHHIGALHAAAKVLTAPRTITTAEELDGLPWGSIILVHARNYAYPVRVREVRREVVPGWGLPSITRARSLLADGKQFTVLHVPSPDA
jgi:hypothetical protein